jgi:arylsulfatase A-like enzyme
MEGRGTVAKITRRNLLKKAAVAAPGAVAGGALLSQAAKAAERSPAAGKNLVIFITDQDRAIQNFPKGWEEENLPGVTRLKRNGASFEKAFAAACMCSPSRASMLTGFFPAQHGVKYTLEENMPSPQYPQVELPTNLRNIGTAMTAAGYEVVFKGKWHMSKPSNGSEFTSWRRTGSTPGTRRTRAQTRTSIRRVAARRTTTDGSWISRVHLLTEPKEWSTS